MLATYTDIGRTYLKKRHFNDALQNYVAAINSFTGNSLTTEGFCSQTEEVNFPSNIYLLATLHATARAFAQYQQYQCARNTYELCLRAIDNLRQSYPSEASRQDLTARSMDVFVEATETALILEDANGAFQIAEKAKSFVLLLAILNAGAKQYGVLPAEMVEQERRLKIEIAFYEKKMY